MQAELPGHYFAWGERLERIFKRTGSMKKTAELMDSEPRWLWQDLRFNRQLKDAGPVGRFECPR